MKARDLIESFKSRVKPRVFTDVDRDTRFLVETTAWSGWISRKQSNFLYSLAMRENIWIGDSERAHVHDCTLKRVMPNGARVFEVISKRVVGIDEGVQKEIDAYKRAIAEKDFRMVDQEELESWIAENERILKAYELQKV